MSLETIKYAYINYVLHNIKIANETKVKTFNKLVISWIVNKTNVANV